MKRLYWLEVEGPHADAIAIQARQIGEALPEATRVVLEDAEWGEDKLSEAEGRVERLEEAVSAAHELLALGAKGISFAQFVSAESILRYALLSGVELGGEG